jgi:hypothetical protein
MIDGWRWSIGRRLGGLAMLDSDIILSHPSHHPLRVGFEASIAVGGLEAWIFRWKPGETHRAAGIAWIGFGAYLQFKQTSVQTVKGRGASENQRHVF